MSALAVGNSDWASRSALHPVNSRVPRRVLYPVGRGDQCQRLVDAHLLAPFDPAMALGRAGHLGINLNPRPSRVRTHPHNRWSSQGHADRSMSASTTMVRLRAGLASAGHLRRLADHSVAPPRLGGGHPPYGTAQLLLHDTKGKLQYLSDECWPITRLASLELCLRPSADLIRLWRVDGAFQEPDLDGALDRRAA